MHSRITPTGPSLRLATSLLLAALAAVLLATCRPAADTPRACTERWCLEGLSMTFPETGWRPGAYEIEVIADGARAMCTGRLPFDGCAGRQFRCDDPAITIIESGCALPTSAHALGGLMMTSIPAEVALTIRHDSGAVARWAGSVEAQCGYPNGPECDPRMCCGAAVDVPINWQGPR